MSSKEITNDCHLEKIKTNLIEKALQERLEESVIDDRTKSCKSGTYFDTDEVVKAYAIDNLLKLERAILETNLEESGSEDDKPLAHRLNQGKYCVREVRIPKINRHKLQQFLVKVEEESKYAQEKRMLKCRCSDCINAQKVQCHWNSPAVILKAIRHSLLTRKWANTTKLLLMLIPHGTKYQLYISEVCEIIEDMNPLIVQNPELSKQFHILHDLYRSKNTRLQHHQIINQMDSS